MNAKIKFIASFLILFFCIQGVVAQKVVAKKGNKTEYKDDFSFYKFFMGTIKCKGLY